MTNGILYPVPKLHTHTVYLHYILTSKHMPLIHLSKGLVYCSYSILILFLIIIIHYHHLFSNTPDYESLLGLVAVKHKAATTHTHTHNPPKLRELISYWLNRPASHYCEDFA
jgi:hypothetical protein